MKTLRDRKSGIYDPDTSDIMATKIDSVFSGLVLDLKESTGYSSMGIYDAAFKCGVCNINYYSPDDGCDNELYKVMDDVNKIIIKVKKTMLDKETCNTYLFSNITSKLQMARNDYHSFVYEKLVTSDQRSTARFYRSDDVDGFLSRFRYVGIYMKDLYHIAFMSGITTDYELNTEDWNTVKDLVSANYKNASIVFCDSVYDACIKLKQQYNKM